MTPPDAGRRVALVKSAGRADAFAVALRDAGFVPVLVAPFRRERIDAGIDAFQRAVAGAGILSPPERLWVAWTSAHAVDVLRELTDALGVARHAAVGHGTAGALQSAGILPEVIGESGGAVLAGRMLVAGAGPGHVVVHPCNADVRPEMSAVLASAGVEVVAVPVYRMVHDPVGERSASGVFHAVVVASPRLAERAAELFPTRPPVVAVGRTTAAALRDLGWPPAAVAGTASPADVAAAVTHVT